MSEDSSFNRDQKKEEERGKAADFSGSMGKGMLAKEKIETLGNSSGLTPLDYGVHTSSLLNCSDQYAENTEMLANSPGLKTLHPFDEINNLKKKRISLIEDFSDNEGLENLKNSSGLTPLNFDSKPQINADERRYSPQRTLRPQSQIITNFANNGE